jgi:hypothetical protein
MNLLAQHGGVLQTFTSSPNVDRRRQIFMAGVGPLVRCYLPCMKHDASTYVLGFMPEQMHICSPRCHRRPLNLVLFTLDKQAKQHRELKKLTARLESLARDKKRITKEKRLSCYHF